MTIPIEQDPIRIQRSEVPIRLGQWYWVLADANDVSSAPVAAAAGQSGVQLLGGPDSLGLPPGKVKSWFGCLTAIGSNYVLIEEPWSGNSRRSQRFHLDHFWSTLLLEPDHDLVIQSLVTGAQRQSAALLEQIQGITAQLGVGRATSISPGDGPIDQEGRALVVLSNAVDATAYKHALVKAQEETLPALFKQVKAANEQMVSWMSAGALSLQAQANELGSVVGEIKQRLFTVSLYAGLTEDVVKVRDGAPAASGELVRVMQQRLYMDEECLMHYRTGGMEFKHIDEFDAWLSEPEHLNTVLPFPRCVVAMRVRRTSKDRDFSGSLADAFVIMGLEAADKRTFLYIRNGERLYRLSTDLDFDELIFPSRDEFDPTEPLMFSTFGSRIEKVITRSEYEARMSAERERQARASEWNKANKAKPEDQREAFNPHDRGSDWSFAHEPWHPFDSSSVYYDDASEAVAERVRKYNRVAVILQGLFDRSEVFHPHPPVQTWTPDGFARAIELIYDGSGTLANGDAPDFEAYRAQLNAMMTPESIVVGQERFWMEREAERENARLANDWRVRNKHFHELYEPYGNPGPGYLASMSGWKPRAKVAQFRWLRKRLRGGGPWGNDFSPIECTLDVPADRLLNVSAYRPGDFKRFFADRRTRAQYLKWAPALMAAEEFHAGNLVPQKPGEGPDTPGGRKRR